MRIGRSFLLVLLVAAAGSQTVWAAEKSPKLATVRIGYVSRSILDMPYIIARDRGLFREEGLEPELIFIKAAQTVPAMLAGGIDFGTATGTAVAAAVSGVDVRVVFALTDKPSFDLIAIPSITSVQQLRGKKLGVTAYGALAEILARQILIASKVPADQVTFLPLGTSDVTYLALKAGTIDATMLPRRPNDDQGDNFRPARDGHQNDSSDATIVALDPQRQEIRP
jgi:NitT/TauT family transport system substrate-binding protein